ncbi:MAG: Na/Pi cotransporter family protein [Planctomycetes bacterium]|nr:Na/Pi cotransporter family protein [Planctomycetota bacterium]
MLTVVSSVVGGVGLFLLGMILMTDGLKALAGDALRSILAKYTTNRWSAVGAGAGITAIVQSSSATTVATIGFVSAGLLPFVNAVGVIIGANLGTTSTGWLVSLLGLKLNVGKLLLPLIGLGAFAKLVTRGRLAQAGQALAGFGVIFVGIDVLQAGMQDLSASFDPSTWPQATLGGRALLLLIGVAMTVVMQSSSAAVATTLAALSGGTIDVNQAAALVVGQNVGTTVTAAIASIGGSVQAKRTALAHIIFNLVTASVAFAVLPWFTHGVEDFAEGAIGGDHALTIAAFHTAFNLLGALMFVPFLPQYARFIERRIKLKGPRLTQHLDSSLLQVPTVALEAVRNVLKDIGATLFDSLRKMLEGERRWASEPEINEVDEALDETRRFLTRVPPPDTSGFEFRRQLSTLHAIDHLERLAKDIKDPDALDVVRRNDSMRKVAEDEAELLAVLAKQLRDPDLEPDAAAAEAFSKKLAEDRRTARPAILEATAARKIDADRALGELRAQRWLDRLAYHIWRAAHHLRELTRKEMPPDSSSADDAGMAGHSPDKPPDAPPASG